MMANRKRWMSDHITMKTIEAIEKVFLIEPNQHAVIPAEEDPGEWALGAYTVIYHINGMPSIERIEEWSQVSDQLPDKFYVEAINSEVSAVFSLL
tara:strand:+ start:617 stop:901 length:285 start_codon:yes stop_codon:yes gene_type:complete